MTNRLAHQAVTISSPIEPSPPSPTPSMAHPHHLPLHPILDYIPADHRLPWVAKMQASSPNHLYLARVPRHVEPFDYVILDCRHPPASSPSTPSPPAPTPSSPVTPEEIVGRLPACRP